MSVSPSRVLVLSLAGIGNTLLATPMLRQLKKTLPTARLSVLVMFKGSAEALRYNPFVDEVLLWNFLEQGIGRSLPFLKRLRQRRFDILLHAYPSNRKAYNLLGWCLGASRQVGHAYRHDNFRNLNFLKETVLEDDSLHDAEENLRLLHFLGIQTTPSVSLELYLSKEEEEFAEAWLLKRRLTERCLIGFHVGSALFKNQIKRRWAPERFARVADRLVEEKKAEILLFGGKEDEEANRRCEEAMASTSHRVTGHPFLQTAALLARCHLLVTNDSALMHAAAALQVPTVAIFGPTNPAYVRPLQNRYRIVRKDLPCSPCFFYSRRPLTCYRKEKDFACLNWIEPEEVIGPALSLLDENGIRSDVPCGSG